MSNPIVDICQRLSAAGRHIRAVSVTQLSDTVFEIRITLQDWLHDNELLAADKGTVEQTTFERMPDIVHQIDGTVEMIEDWMLNLAKIGDALDVAKFERAGYRSWLTKPFAWRKH